MSTVFIETPLGIASITGDENGVSKISITADKEQVPSDKIPDELKDVVTQLQDYFEGNRTDFNIDLNPTGTDFQKRVWRELSNIPFGKTVSYLDIAKRLGDPKCIRAAATANGKNPLWVVVPCHRVIGSDGSLTGYAGGLWRKKWLLDHENPVKQQSLF
ncbi:methylated-DNA--[protein]-cysteine S-methyltransferase [Aquimarina sp. AD1]|uniref:methylated-DNA--[protein]-cysteine S-methyltransferase n=1 Tax=unclassified Aquimarina TaxID=2627091 RepID=UPI000D561B93|nr:MULTISPECIES: methylated-DNA--[protein]-cysteine S-methyltransferase [unclassified Aquimarina]AXT58745.1 methylated-DNA--[protein]-cysteine S-methyltransferase [Aquimarina sp. AD1]RKN13477.1 methylated-DNA--[protein]-cysteine S-methyltransferase [Aquimarina sp. AD1]